MPMYAELQVILEGLHVALGVVVGHPQEQGQAHVQGEQQSVSGSTLQQRGQQGQEAGAAPDLEETLRRLRDATARNSLEAAAALQQQLAAALAAVGAAGEPAQRGQSPHHLPHFEVHQCIELRLEWLQVSSGRAV